jgi:hypothetical protein
MKPATLASCAALGACVSWSVGTGQPKAPEAVPEVVVTADNTMITTSCRVSIPRGTVIPDLDGNGVIHIAADGITVEFAGDRGAELLGAPKGTPYDQFTGIGIRIEGRKNVTLRGPHAHYYKIGILATRADGLVIDGADVNDGYTQRLRSTPQAEDGADWLYPHNNDRHKWREQYGAGLCVEESSGITIRGVYTRRGQNGIILDRVTDSKIYDNDCSFLTGWGLALWRCERNIISRNAFDFCVRGHVEGVYNRGQDSAGILMFEQNVGNVIAENSATHGGDGLFGFSGIDALGQTWMDAERDRLRKETGRDDVDALIKIAPEVLARHKRLGNTGNLIIANDFSYAPAHGIETTFGFDNQLIGNRLVENAICGVWGGYSQDNLIAENQIEGNGGMAYGLERGGINIEHGAGNLILNNTFVNNKCAVHLWWDPDTGLLSTPWSGANDRPVTANIIAGNTFEINASHPFGRLRSGDRLILVQLRDDPVRDDQGNPVGPVSVLGNVYVDNTVRIDPALGVELAVDARAEAPAAGEVPSYTRPDYTALGQTRPVGARAHLRGRDKIIMTEWGPWDHRSPLARLIESSPTGHAYEMHGLDAASVRVSGVGINRSEPGVKGKDAPWVLRVAAASPGVATYTLSIAQGDFSQEISGSIISAEWDVTVFPWPTDVDPRERLDDWRRLASGPSALKARVGSLRFPFGGGGPSQVGLSEEITAAGLPPNHFGTIARTALPLTPGRWRVTTTSDDGVRVTIDGRPVIENWTWHGPTRDTGEFDWEGGEAEIVVEHFEIDGHAVLEFGIEPAE